MSFTNIRKFCSLMEELGYPSKVSMESFNSPNFELVANSLHWLMLRFDPTIDLVKDISTEASRVNFVKAATKLMLARAKIKLNPKFVYSADGYAVKELLKIATILKIATKRASSDKVYIRNDNTNVLPFAKPHNAKATRTLVNEITKCGTALYDMLNVEPKFKEQRDQILMKNVNMDDIEFNIRQAIELMLTSITQENQELCCKEDREKILHSKCEKLKLELKRSEKRFSTLQNVKPTYTDQYDEMKSNLCNLFKQYIEKFQNLKWLETEVRRQSHDKQIHLNEDDRCVYSLQMPFKNEDENSNNELEKNIQNLESLDESAITWNWLPERSLTITEGDNLDIPNETVYKRTPKLETPLSESNWEDYNLGKNAQKMPSRKSNSRYFAKGRSNDFQSIKLSSVPIEPTIEEYTKTSVGDYEESKCGGEESDDDLMDINAAICDYGLDSDTGSDDF
ncbi:uncharacterized protein [Physcomitrium patens]|uniref:uncharacterized protein isoform X2 n=1 Tax=Physcomitrium patens TaxID=3218 RepID=UPI003CCCC369